MYKIFRTEPEFKSTFLHLLTTRYSVMEKIIKLPFYVKLCCTLISMVLIGYLCIIGQTILIPLLFALLCALILLPMAYWMERRLRFPRAISSIACMLLLTSAIFALFTLLGSQLSALANDWPAFRQQVAGSLNSLQQWISDTFHVNARQQIDYLNSTAAKSVSTGTSILGQTLLSLTSVLVLLIFTFLYGFFLLLYRRQIVRFLLSLFDVQHSVTVEKILAEIQYIVKKYIFGLFLQMLIVASLSFAAFFLIGIKYGFLLALITGVFNIIPYIGIFTALLLSVLITFATSSASHVLLVIFSLVIIHAIDGNYVMPRIVGSKVKLNSLFAMLAIVLGELMWGIPGMFLAIPMVAIIKVVFDRVQELKSWGYLLGDDENGLLSDTRIAEESDRDAHPPAE